MTDIEIEVESCSFIGVPSSIETGILFATRKTQGNDEKFFIGSMTFNTEAPFVLTTHTGKYTFNKWFEVVVFVRFHIK
jgi:hypothetical protein